MFIASSSIKALPVRPVLAHGVLISLLLAAGVWLAGDFLRERERTLAEVSRLAMHKSQLIGTLFGDTFIAADYVLRDVEDHIDMALARGTALVDLAPLLEKKLGTVPALTQLAILDKNCIFTALGRPVSLLFTKSKQSFCSSEKFESGRRLHVQYMPAEQSANGQPVVLLSRVIGSPQEGMRAAAMAVMELDYAQRWIESFELNALDVQTIIDRDGVIIARNPLLPETIGKRTASPSGQSSLESITASTTFIAPSPHDHRERIFGLSKLEHFPFIAIVGYDKERALEGWQQRAWQFSIGFAAMALLSIAFLRAYLKTLAQSQALRTLATTDALTGIANRRDLFERGEQEVVRALRYGNPLSVLMIDIDLFKSINDRCGHPCGDRVIRNIADLMRSILRTTDTCGRLGGEEFTAILPETDGVGAAALAERLRLAAEASEVSRTDDDRIIHYTVSIGVSTLRAGDAAFETQIQRADQALYHAKALGRNCVSVAVE